MSQPRQCARILQFYRLRIAQFKQKGEQNEKTLKNLLTDARMCGKIHTSKLLSEKGGNIMNRCANTAMDMMMSMCMCSMCMFCRAYISELQPSGVDIKDL